MNLFVINCVSFEQGRCVKGFYGGEPKRRECLQCKDRVKKDPSAKLTLKPPIAKQDQHRSLGPGSQLKRLLKSLGIGSMEGCGCNNHAREMDRLGAQWCSANIDTIEKWLTTEGRRRNWLFGVAAKLSARQLIHRAIAACEPDAIHLHSSSLGIGDSVCALYAVCGFADAIKARVVYHCRHPEWLTRVAHPNVTIVPHAGRGVDIGGGMGAYRVQIASSESRVKKYCQDLATAFKVKPFIGARPQWIASATRHAIYPGEYSVLAPFSCHAVREWPSDKWRQLAIDLRAAGKKVIAIGAGGNEKAMDQIFDSTGAECFAGRSADWICDLVAGASCLVTNDSGPAHLGGLLGTSTIAIHAGSLPHDFLFDCAPSVVSVVGSTALERSDHHISALASVRVDQVLESLASRPIAYITASYCRCEDKQGRFPIDFESEKQCSCLTGLVSR